MEPDRELTLRPIGRVVQGRSAGGSEDRWEEAESLLEIDSAWAGALDGIEGFSHIWVVWWIDQPPEVPSASQEGDGLHVRPEMRDDLPLMGILATRSPRRPNPIALTAVRLLEHRSGRLRVQGLDAYEGTPVLDIKPYLRRGDLIPDATMPGWLERLWQIHDTERC